MWALPLIPILNKLRLNLECAQRPVTTQISYLKTFRTIRDICLARSLYPCVKPYVKGKLHAENRQGQNLVCLHPQHGEEGS